MAGILDRYGYDDPQTPLEPMYYPGGGGAYDPRRDDLQDQRIQFNYEVNEAQQREIDSNTDVNEEQKEQIDDLYIKVSAATDYDFDQFSEG